MFCAFVWSFIIPWGSLTFRFSLVASSPPGHVDPQWFMGCVNASSELYARSSSGDLDPVKCSVSCLDAGYQVAALTVERCYCGNQELQGFLFSECFNTSATKDVVRQSYLYLPVGGGRDNLAIYRTSGPFLHRIRLHMSPNRVHAAEPFVVQVSGNLAGRLNQPTGIWGLEEQDFCDVTVEFQGLTPRGQSSHRVSVQDDGSFAFLSEWSLEAAGEYDIHVTVSNLLSSLSSALHVVVSLPSIDGLVIHVLPGPRGVPPCVPLLLSDSHGGALSAAYLGDPVTLQANISGGSAAGFHWWIRLREREEKEETSRKIHSESEAEHMSSAVNWIFDVEGVYEVSVNASNAHEWTRQTISIVIVRAAVSDLKLSVSGNQLSTGEVLSVDVELLNNPLHLLFLSFTLNALHDLEEKAVGGGGVTDYLMNTDCKNITYTNDDIHTGKSHRRRSNDCDCSFSHHCNISQHQCESDATSHPFTPLHLLHASSCRLRLPSAAGRYRLSASVVSTAQSGSALLSAVLTPPLIVYEPIRAVRPSGTWKSVSTHAEFSLEVISRASRFGSKLVWTFYFNDTVVINRTTEKWTINVSVQAAGGYNVTVTAFNPISSASFHTRILAQDPVGDLVLKIPKVITANQTSSAFFSVRGGSEVAVTLLTNGTSLYSKSSYATGKETKVVLLFHHTGTVVVELRAENQVSSQRKSVRVCVERKRKPSPLSSVNSTWKPPTSQSPEVVRIYAADQAHPTNADVNLLALTDASDPVDFLWYFGDSSSVRTTSRSVTKRYKTPSRYNVTVVMSSGRVSVTSEVFPLVIQRAVKLNRLVHRASVLQNRTVTMSCRVNVGTDVEFLWSFGDGSSRSGLSTEQHVFHRTGEFTVEVKVSNLVSSASLTSQIFVVDQPCQPPPVKNMGPLKIQVRRYEVIHLGVTYETEVGCDVSRGLHYSWSLYDSAGRSFPLPRIDTHGQSLILPSHHLHYDTYTATARVQVVGSIVYSNYSVRVQVMPSPPIAIIDGGTNIFINNRNTTIVTLDGSRSYDPDFPLNPVSLTWTCKPLSSIISSCFERLVPASSPVLTFPASFLKHNFDQFRFTLTTHSGERLASSETFLTVTSNLKGKVSVSCPLCRGDLLNWDQSLSISASCEDCDISPKLIQFSWSLYLVNASSKPVIEIPFCSTLDLDAPSAIVDNPTASALIPETSTLNPPNTVPTSYTPPPLSPKMTQRLLKKGEEPFDEPPYLHPGSSDSRHFSDASGYGDIVSEPSAESDSSAGWEFPVLESGDFESHYDDVPFLTAEEGDSGVSAGRATGVDGETFSPVDGLEFDPVLDRDEGSNLVDSQPPVRIQEPTLLDLTRDPVDRGIFESYTSSGISSALLSFRPFSLKPGSRYMLEVTAKSQNSFLGRTQLFLKTEAVPRGMTCQIQPMNGLELHTHFSVFCTSGREYLCFWTIKDLLYKYSFSVGDRAPRTLYEGTDFQYYFNLPSGDPSNDYKVTVFTEIRSSTDGGVTKPCPVTVRVRPRFHREASSSHNDPDLELSEFGLKNLSALVGLGNSMETLNRVGLLSSILNRRRLDSHEHRRIRNILICTACELEHPDQVSVGDVICTLKELLQVTGQVTLASARRVILYVQSTSEQFADSSAPVRLHLDQKTLNTLVELLSYSFQTVTSAQISHNTDIKEGLETDGCLADVSTGSHMEQGGFISSKQLLQLVADILHTASNLMLKFILFHKPQELRLDTGFMCVYVTYLNQTSTISSGSANVFIPASFIRRLFVRHIESQSDRNHENPCVLMFLTELTCSPYTWAGPGELTEPVVEVSFYRCSTRRKIPIQSVHQPINIDLQQAPKDRSSVYDSILHHSQINYHSFNITQEHLQQVIQLRVQFKPPSKKMFPIMLLFRMFERPTPSMHHLRRIHNWESDVTHITLPPSYLGTPGVGHLAVLNADFAKRRRWKRLSDPVVYRVRVDSSLCVSWDDHQGAWAPHGCRTQQAHTPTAVSCSCIQLRPLTVVKQQIHCSPDTADLKNVMSVSINLTVPIVLVLCVSLYILGLVLIRTTGVEFGERRVHYLSDNLPCDPHLYAVTVHTGICSAAKMSAKVYIVLYGEDGVSQTKELQVPGCTLFGRNSQDTFIISAAENLGSVCRVHIWHDNSGPSPVWYIKQVEVHEVSRGRVMGRPWLFVGQCWLAVNRSDGRVDRMLSVCTQGTGFSTMLYLKVSEYMADFHPWISVCSCPWPHSFTHTHRLTMCLLLLLGYSCVNTVIISQTDEQLPLEVGIADLSAVSVTTGILSVIAVLPAATGISFLFRLRKIKLVGSKVKDAGNRKTDNLEDTVSVSSLQRWTQDGWMKTYQDTELPSVSTRNLDNTDSDEKPVIQTDVTISDVDSVVADRSKGAAFNSGLTSQWCPYVAWVLCLLLCLSCLVLSTVLGLRFSSSEALLWIHSVFFSLLSCIFLIHPALIFTVAVSVSFWYRKTPDIHHFFSFTQFDTDISKLWVHSRPQEPQGKGSNLNKLLAARQRARYLRFVRPPTPRELRKTLCKKRRESIIQRTLWNLSVCASMLLLMLCITFGSSFSDQYHLNNAIRNQFTRQQDNDFMSIKKYNEWWTWAQNNLLDSLYKNESATTELHTLIGEPVLLKTDTPSLFQFQVFSPTPAPNCLHLFRHHQSCSGSCAAVGLGRTKTSAASNLKLLLSCGWLTTQTLALEVHFTLYSPAPNFFTSVTLITQQSPTGVLLPTASVHSVRLYHIPAVWDYIVMMCQLLFLLLSLLQLSHQVITVGQQGLMGYCRTPSNWLEVSVLSVASVYFIHCFYYSTVLTEAVELLQRHNYEEHVDIHLLATQQQHIRTLRGIIVFLLILKCVSVLRVNQTLTTSTTLLTPTLSTLLWTTISGLALFCVGNLLFVQTLSSFPHSLLCPHRRLKTSRSLLVPGWGFRYHGALSLFSRAVFTAAVVIVVSSLAKRSWRRRKDVFTTSEVLHYIRKRFSAFTDWHRPTPTDHPVDQRTYNMEEFESLVDELLCRLNALSDSLHRTLPSKSHRYREDRPAISSVQESSKVDTQDFMKTHMTEETSTTSHQHRSEIEDKMLQVLHPTNQPTEKFSSDISFSSFVQRHETKTGKTTKHRKKQTSLQGPSLLPGPESASCVRLWTSTQTIQSEVVVEVLVHEERGNVDSDKASM